MKRLYGYATLDEADNAATQLLWELRQDEDKLSTTVKRWDDVFERPFNIAVIQDADSGATACLYTIKGDRWDVVLYTADEANHKNRIYPYRNVLKPEKLTFLSMVTSIHIFKPTKEIKASEAQTAESLTLLENFFGDDEFDVGGYDTDREEIENEHYDKDNAFDVIDEREDGTTQYIVYCLPTPRLLTELTGIKVNNKAKNYVKALDKLLGGGLDEDKLRAVEDCYLYNQALLFVKWAIYEFWRTEQYSHLKDVLSQYKAFGLPKGWEDGCSVLRGVASAEIFILAKYIPRDMRCLTSEPDITELAEYTGTPRTLLFKASQVRKRLLRDF